MKAEVFTIP